MYNFLSIQSFLKYTSLKNFSYNLCQDFNSNQNYNFIRGQESIDEFDRQIPRFSELKLKNELGNIA